MVHSESLESRVPQCRYSPNKTRLVLSSHQIDPDTWQCPGEPYSPGCSGGETYVRCESTDVRLEAARAMQWASGEMGCPSPGIERLTIWQGGRVPIALRYTDKSQAIYVTTREPRERMLYQLAHEVVHCICTPEYPWADPSVHEMLAETFAIRWIDQNGYEEYAASLASKRMGDAARISAREFFDHRLDMPPITDSEAYYGRAYERGALITASVGWASFATMAQFIGDDGGFASRHWLQKHVPSTHREVVASLLERP
ncbi:MAG: hypothetical protein JWM90_2365 [Thermoleophilia bacterium]|nr:hypothetical protein [Thermoleophilia bacterium]